jgi:hypothetical protein
MLDCKEKTDHECLMQAQSVERAGAKLKHIYLTTGLKWRV